MAESYREDVAGRECHGEDAGKTAVAEHHREETAGKPTERRAKSRTANSSIGYIKSMQYLCQYHWALCANCGEAGPFRQ